MPASRPLRTPPPTTTRFGLSNRTRLIQWATAPNPGRCLGLGNLPNWSSFGGPSTGLQRKILLEGSFRTQNRPCKSQAGQSLACRAVSGTQYCTLVRGVCWNWPLPVRLNLRRAALFPSQPHDLARHPLFATCHGHADGKKGAPSEACP